MSRTGWMEGTACETLPMSVQANGPLSTGSGRPAAAALARHSASSPVSLRKSR